MATTCVCDRVKLILLVKDRIELTVFWIVVVVTKPSSVVGGVMTVKPIIGAEDCEAGLSGIRRYDTVINRKQLMRI